MRIHWHSNAPFAPSGYGNQTKLFLWRLKDLGHHMSMTAFYGLQGSPLQINGVDVFPAGLMDYGNDVLAADAIHNKADIVISLIDAWVLSPAVTSQVNWYPWTPMDHESITPGVLAALQAARRPIAYSRFGERLLKEAGLNPLYVPHGVDTKNEFYPVDREEARKFLGVPEGKFLIGMVMANKGAPSRKAFDPQIRAYAEFHKAHPDSLLYIHTDWSGRIGEDIGRICELNGLGPEDVAQPPTYRFMRGLLGDEYMRYAYNAMDVLMNCSKGGGFEIPLIEAQACGTPVITTDFTAMPELVKVGWKVGYSDKFFSEFKGYWATPSVPEMVNALEEAYTKRDDTAFRQQARDAMVAEYDADFVTQTYWKPVLEEIEAELHAPVEREIDHVKLWVRPGTWDEMIAHNVSQEYFPDLIDYRRVQRVVDVGAHIGSYTRRVKAWNPGVQVAAIEANPENAALLKKNTSGIDGIGVYEARLGYQAGEMVMLSWDFNSGGHTLVPKAQAADSTPDGASSQPFEGVSLTLDEVLAQSQFECVDVLKLDCEGSEFDILLNAPMDTLARCEWIVGEVHYQHGDIRAVIDRLAPAFDLVVHHAHGVGNVLGLFCFRKKHAGAAQAREKRAAKRAALRQPAKERVASD